MVELPIIQNAIAHGERVAVREVSRDCTTSRHTTYAELVQGSLAMAVGLLGGNDDLQQARVAYLIPAGRHYIVTQWGIWRAGGIAVPLSLSATEQELEYVLLDSQATTVVTVQELASKLSRLCERQGLHFVIADKNKAAHTAHHTKLPNVSLHRRAMILYTSGTTNKPKGVVTTHECIQAQIETLVEAWNWQASDNIPLFLPLHHIHGIINCQSCALWIGAQIEAFSRFDQKRILERVSEQAYTVFMAVPTIYVKLIEGLKALSELELKPVAEGFAKMRLMVSGSAALPASVHRRWTELVGQKLLERYGMTEIGMALSNPYNGERRPGAVGHPLPRVQVRLQTETGDTVLTEDTPGEIQVRGPNVFLEYWKQPEVTRSSFVNGWFRTGDVAVIERGYYRILGRTSVDIIKSGGYKLSALEIEATLLDHPHIVQCAVVGIPDKTWGETVAAAVVLAPGTALGLDVLTAWCRDRISRYKIPRRLLVVDALPRNAMGKVTKPAVQGLFQQET